MVCGEPYCPDPECIADGCSPEDPCCPASECSCPRADCLTPVSYYMDDGTPVLYCRDHKTEFIR